ncbi:MAG: GlsB/YeaQ/YmgE family stress response membrane protein [Fusobacteriaceae bacterium]
MGIFSWIVLGIIAGALGKFIMPGKDGGGFFKTMALGIAGAFLGGFVGSFFGMGSVSGVNFSSIITATVGAIAVLWIGKKF